MRLAVLFALGLLTVSSSADARPKRHERTTKKSAIATPISRGQSIGAPWSGELRNPSRMPRGEAYHLRRPHRAFGTRTTVRHLRQAIRDTFDNHPKAHVLAIGDLSVETGGWISDHHSHRSGRDVDIGLFFKKQPAGYPESFVDATDANLDRAATWSLIRNLLQSSEEDGGVQVIFLDFDVQGIIYKWAKANGVSEKRLNRVFQFPHGRGASAGMVRHEPNHRDHLHVRYRCAAADKRCR